MHDMTLRHRPVECPRRARRPRDRGRLGRGHERAHRRDRRRARAPERGEDLAGDLLLPGLVELHTDHLEAHYVPRPEGALGPGRGRRVLRRPARDLRHHDRARFAAGLARGGRWGGRRQAGILADAIATARDGGSAPHRPFPASALRSADAGRGRGNAGADRRAGRAAGLAHGSHAGAAAVPRRGEAARLLPRQERRHDRRRARRAVRQAASRIRRRTPRRTIATSSRSRAAHDTPLASHDDTTAEHVAEAIREAWRSPSFRRRSRRREALHAAGIRVLMGAPNLVRGGSHAGNVATAELARAGALDVLSSDYVPASLLMAALRLPKAVPEIDAAGGDPHGDQDPGRGGRAWPIAARSRSASAPISSACASPATCPRCAACGAAAGGWHELVRDSPAAVDERDRD